METLRAFVAWNLDVASMDRVAAEVQALRRRPGAPFTEHARAAWVAPPKMHVTLKFLGDIDAALVPALAQELERIAESTPPVRLGRALLGGFPDDGHARVFVERIEDPHGDVAELHAAVERRFADLGLPREERRYHPHLTLARVRGGAVDLRKWISGVEPLDLRASAVTEIVLYRSDLAQAGSEYTALARFALPTEPPRSPSPTA